MTHDELMVKIDKELICYCGHLDLCDGIASKEQAPSWYALRALVKLHKRVKPNRCQVCWTAYPCPTIQVIEKELQ